MKGSLCYSDSVRRVLTLPDRGKLIVATDLQGNVTDFDRLATIFERAASEPGGAILVITGDLVHGPELAEADWPDYLGTYYRGDSRTVLERAYALAGRHPGKVHYLLGNHEHAHVGGPVVAKFFPDEARRLEELLGDDGTARMRAWLRTWPFAAATPSTASRSSASRRASGATTATSSTWSGTSPSPPRAPSTSPLRGSGRCTRSARRCTG